MIKDYLNFEISASPTWFWLLLIALLLISTAFQLYYYFSIYYKVSRYKKVNTKSVMEPVSVIICARNEADNLQRFLPSVLNQFYPEFEVIVVNDGSTDQSDEVLDKFKEQYSHLYVTGIEHRDDFPQGKKLAQTIGIKAAHHDQLLFTDADCEPVNPNWIRHMQSNFLNQTQIVLGYGKYISEPGLLNKWIRTDTVYIAMQYLGMALTKHPFMGVGRNLAYRRSLFFEKKGFASHLNLSSGDDDLFVNENADPYNTVIEIHRDSFTQSDPEKTFKQWLRQKKRHLTTSPRYKKNHKMILGMELLSRVLFYLLAATLLSFGVLPLYIGLIVLLRFLVFSFVFKRTMVRLREKNLLLLSLIYDLLWPFLGAFLALGNTVRKKNTVWK